MRTPRQPQHEAIDGWPRRGPARQHGQLTDALAGAHLGAELSPPRLGALSTAVARRFKSYYGGEPPKAASVRFYDGYVGTVLAHRLTRAEPSLVGRGHAPLVGERRSQTLLRTERS